jgi:hypothetical protein
MFFQKELNKHGSMFKNMNIKKLVESAKLVNEDEAQLMILEYTFPFIVVETEGVVSISRQQV